jgi:hypothetical protein
MYRVYVSYEGGPEWQAETWLVLDSWGLDAIDRVKAHRVEKEGKSANADSKVWGKMLWKAELCDDDEVILLRETD